MRSFYSRIRGKKDSSSNKFSEVPSLSRIYSNNDTQTKKSGDSNVNTNLGSLYEDIIKTKEKKIPPLVYLYIILGIIPILPYLLIGISKLPNINDNVRYFGTLLIFNPEMMEFLTIFTAMAIPLVFIKLYVVNRPSRLARISKKLSSIFLGRRSFICGLEVVRRKQFRNLIVILTDFVQRVFCVFYAFRAYNQDHLF